MRIPSATPDLPPGVEPSAQQLRWLAEKRRARLARLMPKVRAADEAIHGTADTVPGCKWVTAKVVVGGALSLCCTRCEGRGRETARKVVPAHVRLGTKTRLMVEFSREHLACAPLP